MDCYTYMRASQAKVSDTWVWSRLDRGGADGASGGRAGGGGGGGVMSWSNPTWCSLIFLRHGGGMDHFTPAGRLQTPYTDADASSILPDKA